MMVTLATLVDGLRTEIESGAEFTSKNIPGGNVGLLALIAVAYFSVKYVRNTYLLSKTKQKILARQAKAEAGKLKLQHRLEQTKIDITITDLPFAELQQKLQLPLDFRYLQNNRMALEATRQLNCVTDFIESAEGGVGKLAQLEELKTPIQRQCRVTTAPAESAGSSTMCVKRMEFCFSVSCSNPIFGETVNPKDKLRTCGGSTGGEGALIGAGASIMGVGCDMGGSIRIPCHFCGICGMKPTPHRLSCAGNYTFGQGIVSLAEVYGPMGRDVTSVVELFKASLTPKLYELDPLIPTTPWREELFNSSRPLRIGCYVHDGGLEVSPAVKRCVLQAKRLLESRGHTVVDFVPPEILFATEHLFFATLVGDDCEQILTYLKHDVVDPSLKDLFQMLSIPHRIRVLLSRFSKYLGYDCTGGISWFIDDVRKEDGVLLQVLIKQGAVPFARTNLSQGQMRTVYKWWLMNEELEEYRRRFLAHWKSKNIDAVICPVLPFSAFPRGEEGSCMAGITYTSIYNIVGLPTGVVPGGKVEKADLDKLHNEYPKRNQAEKYMHKVCKNSEGLPVGVQCVALPFQEEIVLRVMRELEEGLPHA
ncbi:hypothetical protein EGW08_017767 [Elysia chlorotica]|uniref:Amidase domain-containing protein n=1 Tax=Elysia chlorotica TaxID=188477 RepID=A0A3S0ZSX6_ELYCH|nr:hypothetical protein EGW08_017767 [Elysia chlorotica]